MVATHHNESALPLSAVSSLSSASKTSFGVDILLLYLLPLAKAVKVVVSVVSTNRVAAAAMFSIEGHADFSDRDLRSGRFVGFGVHRGRLA